MNQRCAQCGHDNPEAARFCSHCGAPMKGDLVRSATRLSPLMQQWRGLSTRTTRRELRQLLGEPARIDLSDPTDARHEHAAPGIETWTYEYEVAARPEQRVSGRVLVNACEGRLLSWVEPDWEALTPAEANSEPSTPSRGP
jgi:hypothetical protein